MVWVALIPHCRAKVSKCPNDPPAEGLGPLPLKWPWGPEQSFSGLEAFENLPEDCNALRQNYHSYDFNLKVSVEVISSTRHVSYVEHLGAFMPS